jgi:methylmalonyl-CoA mutase N-terminal domain/subunit
VTARDTTSSGGGAAAGVRDAAEYGPEALKGWDPAQRLGTAGSFPFTRHIHPGGAASRPPAPSLYCGFGTPEDANRRFRFLIERGNARANCAVDLPTQIGLDSDDPDALGEVGRVGVAIDSLEDVVTMFDGVPLDRTPVDVTSTARRPDPAHQLGLHGRRHDRLNVLEAVPGRDAPKLDPTHAATSRSTRSPA